MPDSITPVGTQSPYDPMSGIKMLSGVLGLQQQQQGLQLGRQKLQTGQAEVEQSQQRNQELQRLASFTKDAISSGKYQLADGSPDVQSFQRDAMAVAPTYGQEFIGHTTSNFREAVATRQAMQNLSTSQNKQISDALKGIATNPNATSSDLLDVVSQLRSNNKDPAFNRALDNFVLGANRGNIQEAAATAASALGGIPRTEPGQQDLSGAVQPGAVTTMGPGTGGFAPVGPAVNKRLAPQVISPPGGIPTVVGGGVGLGGGGKNLSGFSGPQPTDQEMQGFGQYQSNLNNRVRVASDVLPRIQMAERALDQVRAGAGAKSYNEWAQRLQAIGAPASLVDAVAGGNLAKAQEAEKLLFQTTFAGLKQSMQGDPARVAEFEAAEKVFPTLGTDPRATKEILRFMTDQGQRDFSEQQAMTSARKNGTLSPTTWEADYQSQLRKGQVSGVPQSQIPQAGKKLPTGAKMDKYAQTHFGGDAKKAAEFLKSQGYE